MYFGCVKCSCYDFIEQAVVTLHVYSINTLKSVIIASWHGLEVCHENRSADVVLWTATLLAHVPPSKRLHLAYDKVWHSHGT